MIRDTKFEEGDLVLLRARIVNVRKLTNGEVNYDVSLENAKVVYGDELYFVEEKDLIEVY